MEIDEEMGEGIGAAENGETLASPLGVGVETKHPASPLVPRSFPPPKFFGPSPTFYVSQLEQNR